MEAGRRGGSNAHCHADTEVVKNIFLSSLMLYVHYSYVCSKLTFVTRNIFEQGVVLKGLCYLPEDYGKSSAQYVIWSN